MPNKNREGAFRRTGPALLLLLSASAPLAAQGLPLAELRALTPSGVHPCDAEYFTPVMYANALFPGHDDGSWIEFDAGASPFQGANLPTFNNPSRFDAQGFPKNLPAGKELGLNPWSLNNAYSDRPAGWPNLRQAALGRWVLTWTGRADIRLSGGSPEFLAESNVPATGLAVNGRRVYRCPTDASLPNKVIVHAVDSANPVTDLKLWLPDPSNPQNLSLERPGLPAHRRLFHPSFLARLQDRNWSYIRMMDLGFTNNSPVRDWSDRRLPGHVFPIGVLNPRDALDGRGSFTLTNERTGIPWEHMVALCNQTGKDLWLNIPHLASADCMLKLAKLIRFGSDGTEPYETPQADPVWPPLDPARKVYLEYSNEVWNAGAFGQGGWAIGEAAAQGKTREELIAARASAAWLAFESVLGTARLVRVGAVQTGSEGYSRSLLTAWRDTPGLVQPELMAVTTYFGHNLQYFLNTQGFFTNRLGSDPYWQSPAFAHHLDLAYDRWEKFILEGTAAEDPSGRGDNVADPGGIPANVAALAREFHLPMVAYEGGNNFFTNSIDTGAAPANAAVTIFMEAFNRHPRHAQATRLHLEFARSLGLWSHMPFQLASGWGRFGQWGHLESMEQLPSASPKYQAVLDWFDEHNRAGNPSALRHPDDPAGAVPAFTTPAALPLAVRGQTYLQALGFAGGNGTLTWTTLGFSLPEGLVWDEAAKAVRGTPRQTGEGRVFARVHDADGDPVWRLFSLRVVAPGGALDLDASEDAPVVQFSGNAGTNLGSSQQMQIVNPLFDTFFGPPDPGSADGAKAYLKFDLSSLVPAGVTVSSAVLELHKASDGAVEPGAAVILFATDNTWSENTITFNNRPAAQLTGPAVQGQPLPGLLPPAAFVGNNPLLLNVTAHIQSRMAGGATAVSFVVAGKDYTALPNLAGREHFDAARHPRLRLTLAGTATPDPLKTFTHISVHAGDVYVAWPIQPGVTLQTNPGLEESGWINLPATATQAGFSFPVSDRRFFRLAREE